MVCRYVWPSEIFIERDEVTLWIYSGGLHRFTLIRRDKLARLTINMGQRRIKTIISLDDPSIATWTGPRPTDAEIVELTLLMADWEIEKK